MAASNGEVSHEVIETSPSDGFSEFSSTESDEHEDDASEDEEPPAEPHDQAIDDELSFYSSCEEEVDTDEDDDAVNSDVDDESSDDDGAAARNELNEFFSGSSPYQQLPLTQRVFHEMQQEYRGDARPACPTKSVDCKYHYLGNYFRHFLTIFEARDERLAEKHRLEMQNLEEHVDVTQRRQSEKEASAFTEHYHEQYAAEREHTDAVERFESTLAAFANERREVRAEERMKVVGGLMKYHQQEAFLFNANIVDALFVDSAELPSTPFLQGLDAHVSNAADINWASSYGSVFKSMLRPFDHTYSEAVRLSRQPLKEIDILELFEVSNKPLLRPPYVLAEMQNLIGQVNINRRAQLGASLIMTVHFFRKFCIAVRDKLLSMPGASAEEAENHYQLLHRVSNAYSRPHDVRTQLCRGDFTAHNEFVSELLFFALNRLDRLAPGRTWICDTIFEAEYHLVRAAVDCISSDVLYICLLGPEYLTDMWAPYMKQFHRSITVHPEKKHRKRFVQGPSDMFDRVVFYLPPVSINILPNPQDFLHRAANIIEATLSKKFRGNVISVETPPGYESLKDLFITDASLAKRMSPQTPPPEVAKTKQKRQRSI